MQRRDILASFASTAAGIIGISGATKAQAFNETDAPTVIFLTCSYPLSDEQAMRLKTELRIFLNEIGWQETKCCLLECCEILIPGDRLGVA